MNGSINTLAGTGQRTSEYDEPSRKSLEASGKVNDPDYLNTLGWTPALAEAFNPLAGTGFEPGRVAVEHKGAYLVYTRLGEVLAEASGRLLYTVDSPADLPKVGDWVALSLFSADERAIIHQVLPRASWFSRHNAGKKAEEQIIATNVDVIFVVQGLDGNFNPRRLERYLVMVYEGGARPVVILNKTDLCADIAARLAEVERAAPGVPVIPLSARTGQGLEPLRQFMGEGVTIAFIGSSGVGKSTLINALAGSELQKTFEVREDDSRGRHTTTRRELIVLPGTGLLIDTPGMRELQLWGEGDGLADTFADIAELAHSCHFADCTHTRETKCAVRAAVESGELPADRYASYLKLQKELLYLAESESKDGSLERKRRDKVFQKLRNKVVRHDPKYKRF